MLIFEILKMADITDLLESKLKPYLAGVAVALAIFFGVMDYLTDPNLSFLILYLIPILIVVWVAGRWVGIILAVVCTAGWFVSDLLTKPVHPLPVYANPLISSWNVIMEMSVFLLMIYLVSALKDALLHEKELARTDFLTGVANKRYFSETATLELTRARRYKRPFALAYMDLDNFKSVNDNLGHKTGDSLLHLVAGMMKNNLRTVDTVARLGGDEFVIFMPETRLEQTRVAIDRIQRVLMESMRKNQWPVTFSVGVVSYDKPPLTLDEVIKAADGLMYSAKTRGKNMVLYEQREVRE